MLLGRNLQRGALRGSGSLFCDGGSVHRSRRQAIQGNICISCAVEAAMTSLCASLAVGTHNLYPVKLVKLAFESTIPFSSCPLVVRATQARCCASCRQRGWRESSSSWWRRRGGGGRAVGADRLLCRRCQASGRSPLGWNDDGETVVDVFPTSPSGRSQVSALWKVDDEFRAIP
jgi:hypothetical protein